MFYSYGIRPQCHCEGKAINSKADYHTTTNVSMLLILAILANGIKTLILIPANNYTQSCGCRMPVSERHIE